MEINAPTGGINNWRTETLIRRALDANTHKAARNFIAALHWRGTREVFDRAALLCRSNDTRKRDIGAQILEQLGVPDRTFPDESLEILFEMLRTEKEPDVIMSIFHAIGHTQDLEDSAGLDLILDKINHEDEEVRFAAVHALSGKTHKDAIAALIELSRDTDHDVRDWATFGLGTQIDTNNQKVRDALWDRVNDSHLDTKCEAIVGLARRHDERVRPVLAEQLDQDDQSSLVFEATAEFGDQVFLPQLRAIREEIRDEENVNEGWLNDLDDAIKELQNRQKSV